MYEKFFGFRERPFDLTPNPRFLVPTDSHIEALRNLEYGIASRTGVTLLLGDAGLGKTTIIRAAIDLQPSRVYCCHLTNPTLTRAEFNETLAQAFGLSARAHPSKASMLLELEALLASRHSRRETTVLVVDEAQSMPDQLLEEVRFLANLEIDGEPLVSIVLAGQSELAQRLNEPHLRELKQRAALRCEIRPLTLQETREYIAGRIEVAGGPAEPIFLDNALQLIHEAARGVPRTINVIADNALLGAFAAARGQVDADMVSEVCRDFNLDTGPRNFNLATGPREFNLDTAPDVGGLHAEVFPEFSPAAVPPPSPSARRRVFGYVAGLVLLLMAVTIGAGLIAPEATQRVEPAGAAASIDAVETPLPEPAAPLDAPAPVAESPPRLDLQPAVSSPAVPVASPAVPVADPESASRPTSSPPAPQQVETRTPPLVPDESRGSTIGAVAATRSGGPGSEEPPVSPTVTERLSQSPNASRLPSSGAPLPVAETPPLAFAEPRAIGPSPGPPPPAPVVASAPPPSPAPEALETAEIQSVLAQYRHALETLSASGLESVWPTVDTGNLQRAFDQLSEQSIEFDSCTIDLTTTSEAAASCSGRASIVRKVGSRELRSEPRQWTFHLSRANAGWTIERVESR